MRPRFHTLILMVVLTAGVPSCTLAKTLVSPITGPAIVIDKSIDDGFHVGHVFLWLHVVPFVIVASPVFGLVNGVRSDINVITGKTRDGGITRYWWSPFATNHRSETSARGSFPGK